MSQQDPNQYKLWGDRGTPASNAPGNARKSKAAKESGWLPDKLGKAVRLPVPDFSDPARKPTCLEVDFPIAPINALSSLEGNAGKPIYQMSKWWARRRSSVFRSLLIAAATEAPDDPTQAAKRVWDAYYGNHQKAGAFRKLRVLDPFMGGGTTLVEGARLGFQMTGVDLNPVAVILDEFQPWKVVALSQESGEDQKEGKTRRTPRTPLTPNLITHCDLRDGV